MVRLYQRCRYQLDSNPILCGSGSSKVTYNVMQNILLLPQLHRIGLEPIYLWHCCRGHCHKCSYEQFHQLQCNPIDSGTIAEAAATPCERTFILVFYGNGGSFDACSSTQVSNLQLSCQLPFKKNHASFGQSNGASSLTSGYYPKGICDYSLVYVLL